MRILQLTLGVLIGGLGAWAMIRPALSASAPADPTEPSIETKSVEFDVFMDKAKVGTARIKWLPVGAAMILNDEFEVTLQGSELKYQTQQVWVGGEQPQLQNAKVSTYVGPRKVMEGTLVFSTTGAAPALTTSMMGYVDRDGRLLEKPLSQNKALPVPAGLVVSHRSLLQFAAAILPKPGQKDKIIYMHFPMSIHYPGLVSFTPNCRLVRQPFTVEGNSTFVLKEIFPGGNEELMASVTIDKTGQILESQASRFTWRPRKPDAPPKPADTKPATGK
jgi:hypothetical protein